MVTSIEGQQAPDGAIRKHTLGSRQRLRQMRDLSGDSSSAAKADRI
jgi:hypothetical protein